MEDILIPLAALAIGPIIIWITFHYGSKEKEDINRTVRAAIEKGVDLDPDLISKLGAKPKPSPQADLRKGMFLFSLGLAIFIFALLVPEAEAKIIFGGISLLLIFPGAAFLLLHRMSRKEPS